MSMSGTLHLSSDYFPGYTLSDSRCFSNSAVSRRTLAILPGSSCPDHKLENGRLKCAPNSRSFVCQANSGSYRRNPDFSRLNKHGFRGRNNRPSEERDDFDSEMLSSRNGPLLSLSNSPKFQATCSPGPREKEIVELFRKVQAQLRARAAAKKEDKKIEAASNGQGKESETVDSLLKLLRKHSGDQSKKSVGNFSSHGDSSYPIQGNSVDRRDQNASSFARPTSSFRRNSPVPRSKSPPAYSSEPTFDQASSYSVTWTHKKNTSESHEEPEDGPEAEAELEHEYEDVSEYDSEPEPVTAVLESESELKPESSSFHQEEEDDVTLEALSDDNNDNVTFDVLSDDDDESLDEDDDESEEEAAKDEDLSTLKPPKDSLGIFTPTWFTCAAFLSNEDHCKFVTGTKSHQVRLYDASAQRRPVLSFDFPETAVTAICEDPDGHTIYVGNTSADLAAYDIRTGKLLGSFLGKCSGSIRSVVRHPHHNVIASCGLDRYLRVYDVFLKQHLTGLVFDSSFSGEETAEANTVVEAATEENMTTMDQEDDDDEEEEEDEAEKAPVKKKKSKKEKRSREKVQEDDEDDEEEKKMKQSLCSNPSYSFEQTKRENFVFCYKDNLLIKRSLSYSTNT
ncbi:unnamed protein product [Microthlaspi erraticum]|uniref:Uncharacterized protein n=1 Tax=Microthlaspi erraticum TaxID=1685480 RepID=A0A6D2IDW8_9BRAS|nr:unnamed protein product [Microthlaspi erraticum]